MKRLLSGKEYILSYIVYNFLNKSIYYFLIFIRRIWFSTFPYYLFLLPFSYLYGLVTNLIRLIYKYDWLKKHRFPLTIIIIGNLTVGGNGKTPVVLWLVQKLQNRGWYVGVVSRGYGGYSKNYPILLNEFTSSHECGDEPLLIWQRTKVPIVVSPNRSDAVSMLLKFYPFLDIIISDDGLQHYALARDIEWVVINKRWGFGNGWWLPAGPMRERVTRLDTVQQVIFQGEKNEMKLGEISMQLVPTAVVNLLTNERKVLHSFSSVVAMAGINYPSQFFSTLRSHGIVLIKEISFSDHQVYSKRMLNCLVKSDEILLMTEKDAVKCRFFACVNWWYLEVEANILIEEENLLLAPIEKNIWKYKHVYFK